MIIDGPRNTNLIKLSKLLELFDLDLNLSNELLDVDIDACFKDSKLTIAEDCYEFRFEDYSVIINPSNIKPTMIISEEQDFRNSSLRMFYDDMGVLYKIS